MAGSNCRPWHILRVQAVVKQSQTLFSNLLQHVTRLYCSNIYPRMFAQVLNSFVRCGIPIVTLIKELETVQRRFTKRIFNRVGLTDISYEERLAALETTPVAQWQCVCLLPWRPQVRSRKHSDSGQNYTERTRQFIDECQKNQNIN